jgi:hypothetical protein
MQQRTMGGRVHYNILFKFNNLPLQKMMSFTIAVVRDEDSARVLVGPLPQQFAEGRGGSGRSAARTEARRRSQWRMTTNWQVEGHCVVKY